MKNKPHPALRLAEHGLVPDRIIRQGIRTLSQQRLRQEGRFDPEYAAQRYMAVLHDLNNSPIAVNTDKANEQHYEVPAEFFKTVLGPRLKYSACYFAHADNQGSDSQPSDHHKNNHQQGSKKTNTNSKQTLTPTEALAHAEEYSLAQYCERAQLRDGQQILELGCGWGSLSLWMAAAYPNASITSVSNSNSQREYIMQQANAQGLTNLQVLTKDVNELQLPHASFDRVVSVEMFEHVRNYQHLFANIAGWLKDDGLLWCHIFCHRFLHYPFEVNNNKDWMSQYFFTGGLMPAASTFAHFQQHLTIQNQWQWSGEHYQHTANAWLYNMDANKTRLKPLFKATYGKEAAVWWQRWRMFFMACAELFGLEYGQEWVIGHYLFGKTSTR